MFDLGYSRSYAVTKAAVIHACSGHVMSKRSHDTAFLCTNKITVLASPVGALTTLAIDQVYGTRHKVLAVEQASDPLKKSSVML